MTTATTSIVDMTTSIVDAIAEFGIANVDEFATTIYINKNDLSDIKIADSEFVAYTEAHATAVSSFINYEDRHIHIDRSRIREWLQSIPGADFE